MQIFTNIRQRAERKNHKLLYLYFLSYAPLNFVSSSF